MTETKIEIKRGVSPSSMNRYFGCPRQFLYDEMFKQHLIPQIWVEMKEARLGTNFHSMIIPEYFENISDRPDAHEVEMVARDSFEANFDESLWDMKKTAQGILDNFIAFERNRAKNWRQYKPNFMEKKFIHDDFLGIVDFYCDGVVIDWKTGGHVEMNSDLMRQGRTYKAVLETETPPIPVRKVLFPALQLGKVLEMPDVTLSWLQNERRRFVAGVESGEFPAIRSPKCAYCAYILRCYNDGVRGLWD